MTCKRYDVVVVPFPFTDRQTSKRRPVALSSLEFSAATGHTVLAMITSANNPPWTMDIPFDHAQAGLHAPSKVRMKIFTLDNRLIIRKAGVLSQADQGAVATAVKRLLST